MTDIRSGDDREHVDHFAIAQDLAKEAEKYLDACHENPLAVRYRLKRRGFSRVSSASFRSYLRRSEMPRSRVRCTSRNTRR